MLEEYIRKYILNKYPYNAYYSLKKGHLYIMAIAHQHSKPDYWIDRFEE